MEIFSMKTLIIFFTIVLSIPYLSAQEFLNSHIEINKTKYDLGLLSNKIDDNNYEIFGFTSDKTGDLKQRRNDFFIYRVKFENDNFSILSRKEINPKLCAMYPQKSIIWERDEKNNKINLIAPMPLRSNWQFSYYYYVCPTKFVLDNDYNIISQHTDSNNTAVVDMSFAPPICDINNSLYMLPVYGNTVFGVGNKGTFGLYFTYYTKDSCKFLDQIYILAFNDSLIKDFEKGEFIKYADIYDCYKLNPYGNSFLFSSAFESRINVDSTHFKSNIDNIIYKVAMEDNPNFKLKWYLRNKDFTINGLTQQIQTTKLFDVNPGSKKVNNFLVSTAFNGKEASVNKNNACISLVDADSGKILKHTEYGSFPKIYINNLEILKDSSIIALGFHHSLDSNGIYTIRKPYIAKLNKNLEFQWDIGYSSKDSNDNSSFSRCIELNNNRLFVYGNFGTDFLGVLLKDKTNSVSLITAENQNLTVTAELSTIKIALKGEDNTGNTISNSTISIFDIHGKELLSRNIDLIPNQEITINDNRLINGVYILRLSNQSYTINKKFIIE